MRADLWMSGGIVPRNVNFDTNCSKYSPSSFSFLTPWQRNHDAFRIGDLVGLQVWSWLFGGQRIRSPPADDRTLISSRLARGLVIFVPECTGFRPQLKLPNAWTLCAVPAVVTVMLLKNEVLRGAALCPLMQAVRNGSWSASPGRYRRYGSSKRR